MALERSKLALLLAATPWLLGLAGCFSPDYGELAFRCEQNKCPGGYTCLGPPGQRFCVRDGAKPKTDLLGPVGDRPARIDRPLTGDRPLTPDRRADKPKVLEASQKKEGLVIKPDTNSCVPTCPKCVAGQKWDGCSGYCPVTCSTVCCMDVCCTGNNMACYAGTCCQRATCAGGACGTMSDGCGGTINCPIACTTGTYCHQNKCVSCFPSGGGPCTADNQCCDSLVCIATKCGCRPVNYACSSNAVCCSGLCNAAMGSCK